MGSGYIAYGRVGTTPEALQAALPAVKIVYHLELVYLLYNKGVFTVIHLILSMYVLCIS